MALPFGTFEAVLEDNLNAGIADAMQALHQDLQKDGQGLSDALQDVRRAVLQLQAPLQLLPQLQRAFRDAGWLLTTCTASLYSIIHMGAAFLSDSQILQGWFHHSAMTWPGCSDASSLAVWASGSGYVHDKKGGGG